MFLVYFRHTYFFRDFDRKAIQLVLMLGRYES